jgi:hypothetical protein
MRGRFQGDNHELGLVFGDVQAEFSVRYKRHKRRNIMWSASVKTILAFLLVATATKVSGETELIIAGRVKGVAAKTHEIVIITESGVETISYTDDTRMSGLRPDSNVQNVMPGDSVVVLYTEKEEERRIQEIKNVELAHNIEALEGEIVSVYRFNRLMFVEVSDGNEEVFHIADNAILILNGQIANISDLAFVQGQRVKVYYAVVLGLKTVQAMEVPPV